MKRFICIFLIVLMCLCLGGCGENNYPTAAYEMLTNAVNNADTELVKSNIKDVAGFRSMMHELAYTIDKDRRFEVEGSWRLVLFLPFSIPYNPIKRQ